MIAIFRKLADFLDRRSKTHVALLTIPMLTTAMLEILSIGLIIPVMQIVVSGQDSDAIRFAYEYFPQIDLIEVLPYFAFAFVSVFIVKNIALLLMAHLINRVIYAKLAIFSTRMYSLYLGQSLTFHSARNSADLLRNLTTGGNRAFEAIRISMMLCLELLLVIATVGLLLTLEPFITLTVGSVLGAIAIGYYFLSSPFFQRWGEVTQTLDGAIIKVVNHGFGSIRDVKILDCAPFFEGQYASYVADKSRILADTTTAQHIPRMLVETLVVSAGLISVFLFSATEAGYQNAVTTLGLFAMASLRLMPSVNRIMQGAANLRNRTAFVDTLHQDMLAGYKIRDAANADQDFNRVRLESDIHINDVSLTFKDAPRPAINHIQLRIPRGASVGIVGSSGAGKSTLMDIIMGLLDPDSGTVEIDGRDIGKHRQAWQKNIGFVPQTLYLIDDTLRQNILLGNQSPLLDKDMENILALSRLGSVVDGLPSGLDTVIGEGGTKLSGGERQRVAIARALSRDPDVLVFDEATSSLDNETEHEISKAIETLSKDKTIFIVAHRMSTVQNCDILVHLEEGQVVDMGGFDELMARDQIFRRLNELASQTDQTETNSTEESIL
jgi:ABC-type multidrug transport system fused ATPase/permease subunit